MKKKSMWIIGILVAIALIGVAALSIKLVFYSNNGQGAYGNRLDGIENYAISDEKIEEVKGKISDNKECTSISYKLQGKIMKFFITVASETDVTTAERLGDNIIDSFTETELGFYDVLIYITSADNVEPYPMIGSKSKGKAAISWTVNKGEVNDEG